MADFEIAYKLTAINEGGYTDNADDNGNWTGAKKGVGVLVGTNHGISAPVLQKHLGRTPTVADMKNILIDTVKAIYKKNYWNVIRGDEMTRQNVANSVYDSAVNMGCGRAIKLAQKAAGLPETGKMNNQTIKALNI
jgi:lysozyme family protein